MSNGLRDEQRTGEASMNDDQGRESPRFYDVEWWGAGVQRRYGLSEKRFSLFNVARWGGYGRPAICGVVPVLYRGPFSQEAIQDALEQLHIHGSVAAPGFAHPEGIVVFHTASQELYKVTLEKDEEPKGKAEWMAKQAATRTSRTDSEVK